MTEEDLAWFIFNEVCPDELHPNAERYFRESYRAASDVGHTKVFIQNPMATDSVQCARKLLAKYRLIEK